MAAQNFHKFPKILKVFQSATGISWIVVLCKKKIVSLMFVSFFYLLIIFISFVSFLLCLVSFLFVSACFVSFRFLFHNPPLFSTKLVIFQIYHCEKKLHSMR